MNHAGIRRAAVTLAVLLVATAAAGNAFGAGRTAAGGYYDPALSVYVPGSGGLANAATRGAMTAALRARSAALNQRYGLGSYGLGAPRAVAAGAGPRGFSWSDASLGASVGAAIVLAFAAAALAAARWRRRPAI